MTIFLKVQLKTTFLLLKLRIGGTLLNSSKLVVFPVRQSHNLSNVGRPGRIEEKGRYRYTNGKFSPVFSCKCLGCISSSPCLSQLAIVISCSRKRG